MISVIPTENISFFRLLESFDGVEPLPFQRIFSLFRLAGCQTMIQDVSVYGADTSTYSNNQNDDISEYFKQLSIYGLTLKTKKRHSLYFFRNRILNIDDIHQAEDKDLLGYIIIDQDYFVKDETTEYTRSYIAESRVPSPIGNVNTLFLQDYYIHLSGKRFKGTGSLFLQQNAITNSSANVAIKMALANGGCNVSSESINKAVNIDHIHKKGNIGLTPYEMCEAIRVLTDAAPFYLHSDSFLSDLELFHSIYIALEFGFPVILLFMVGGEEITFGHAVSISGFTMQPNAWWPLASNYYYRKNVEVITNYLPSFMWCENFILHDENFGPFHYLPTNTGFHKLKHLNQRKNLLSRLRSYIRDTKSTLENISAIIVSPKGFSEKWSQVIALDDSAWSCLELYIGYLEKKSLVPDSMTFKQLFYRNFKERLLLFKPVRMDKGRYFEALKLDNLKLDVSEYISKNLLIVEINLPELFMHNQRRIGEIVFDFDLIDKSYEDSLLLINLPNIISIFKNGEVLSFLEDYSDSGHLTLMSNTIKFMQGQRKT